MQSARLSPNVEVFPKTLTGSPANSSQFPSLHINVDEHSMPFPATLIFLYEQAEWIIAYRS